MYTKPFALRLKGVVSSVQERTGDTICGLLLFWLSLRLTGLIPAQHVAGDQSEPGDDRAAGAYRYGNILFPGGILVEQSCAPDLNISRRKASVPWSSGSIPYTGVPPGQQGGSARPRTVVVPYAYPVFYGGGGIRTGMHPGASATNVTVVVPQQPVPQVIINNSYCARNGKTCSARILRRENCRNPVYGFMKGRQAAHREPAARTGRPSWTRSRPSI